VIDGVIRGGLVVTPDGVARADIRIEAGVIADVGPELPGETVIDARELHILPGVIDVHLHFNEPGRSDWEGAETGSRALAAGGGTLFFDMPLNSTPCTLDAAQFDRKREALEASSITDFGIWGGLVPDNRSSMAELAARGVVGFKAFLCDSGLPEFPRADDVTLYEGMLEAAGLDCPVGVHAESDEITRELSRRLAGQGKSAIEEFLQSRPILAELEAIERATLIARETGCRLHIVHISCGRGVVLAAEARARGADVSIETCAHYLFFTEDDVERLGALAKCAPPLRSREQRDALWGKLEDGTIDIVASDHSPAPVSMKTGDFRRAWGGIAGAQSTLAVVLDRGHHGRGIPLERIVTLLCLHPAERFRIAGKGTIAPGHDADFVLVDLYSSFTLRNDDLQYRHPISPYAGQTFRGVVRHTVRRGEIIFYNGGFPAASKGRLVHPTP